MIQTCKFFTVTRQFNEWGRCNLVRIVVNEDYDRQKIIEELAKEGIFLSGCIAAASASTVFDNRVSERCFVTGTEDDGIIHFSIDDVLDSYWIPNFIDVLNKVSGFVNE